MAEQNEPDHGRGQGSIEPLSPLVKAYIDKQVENAIKQHDESQTKGKKWRNSWRSAGPITKVSFVMTAAIAVATIAYTLIAWGQYCAMQRIATDNSKQAQELINAATQMKNAGWTFSGAAMGINNANWNAASKLQDQATQVARSADAAKDAAIIAQKELTLSERPWIEVNNLKIIDPLTIDNTGKISTSVDIEAKNIGKTPALDTSLRVAFGTGTEKDIEVVKRLCSGPDVTKPFEVKQTIFPDQPISKGLYYGVNKNIGEDWFPAPSLGPHTYRIPRSIVGCICYRSIFTKNLYTTGFTYYLFPGYPIDDIPAVRFNPDTGRATTFPPRSNRFDGVNQMQIPPQLIKVFPAPYSQSLPMN